MTVLTINALYFSIDYSEYDIPTFLRLRPKTAESVPEPIDFDFFEKYFDEPTFKRRQGSVFRDQFRRPEDQIYKSRFTKANSKENIQ